MLFIFIHILVFAFYLQFTAIYLILFCACVLIVIQFSLFSFIEFCDFFVFVYCCHWTLTNGKMHSISKWIKYFNYLYYLAYFVCFSCVFIANYITRMWYKHYRDNIFECIAEWHKIVEISTQKSYAKYSFLFAPRKNKSN